MVVGKVCMKNYPIGQEQCGTFDQHARVEFEAMLACHGTKLFVHLLVNVIWNFSMLIKFKVHYVFIIISIFNLFTN